VDHSLVADEMWIMFNCSINHMHTL